jgi:hypothetical protein
MRDPLCSGQGEGLKAAAHKRVACAGAILAVSLVISACGTGEPTISGMSVRDSTGIRIVEYEGLPSAAGTVSLSPEPVYRYGNQSDDYLFQLIWLGALQPDGSAIVVDAGSQEIVRVDFGGGSHSILARSGEGPNEVRRALGVFVLGQDTVLVEDDGNARFAVFASGTVVRSSSTMGDRSLTTGLRAYGVAPNGDLMMGTSSYRSDFEVPWLPGQLVRLDPETLVADTIGQYDMVPYAPREGPRNPFMAGGDIEAFDDDFIVVRADRPEVVWRGADGATRQLVRWQPDPRYPSESDFEDFTELLRGDLRRVNPQLGGDALERFVNEQLSRYEIASNEPLPVFATIQADDVGRIWLSHFSASGIRGGGVPGYSVVGPDGVWLGEVISPPSFRMLDVASGRVLGVVTDELDVQHIVVFDLDIS